jgi:hypothetical protein
LPISGWKLKKWRGISLPHIVKSVAAIGIKVRDEQLINHNLVGRKTRF